MKVLAAAFLLETRQSGCWGLFQTVQALAAPWTPSASVAFPWRGSTDREHCKGKAAWLSCTKSSVRSPKKAS